MKYLLLLLITLPFISQAQNHSDSVSYYARERALMIRRATDSVVRSEAFRDVSERINYHSSKSDGYQSFMIFGEVADVDFGNFNKGLVAAGFEEMNAPMYRIGFGMSTKHDRGIVDFTFYSGGFRRTSKRGDERISTNFSNALQFDFGYDLVKAQAINIYPYVGGSLRFSTIKYKKPGQTNQNFTDVTNILINETDINESSSKLGYQAGIAFDFQLYRNPSAYSGGYRTSGTMLFIKAGTSGSIGRETYRIGSAKYRPGIEYGRWIVGVGLKFFVRE